MPTPVGKRSRRLPMHKTSSSSVRHDAVPEGRVVAAARAWAAQLRREHPEVLRVGYFGSYARGDYVPGSDFDVLVELSASPIPRWQDRAGSLRPRAFPVCLSLFVFTREEMDRLRQGGDAFLRTIEATIRWIDEVHPVDS